MFALLFIIGLVFLSPILAIFIGGVGLVFGLLFNGVTFVIGVFVLIVLGIIALFKKIFSKDKEKDEEGDKSNRGV